RGATMTTLDDMGAPMTERTTERMASLMIGISLPIFARDRQFQMRNEMDAMQAMAVADVAAMRAETRGRIGEAYANLLRARNLAQLYRTTVLPQAEATVASALSAYRVGSVDFMTLLDDRMTVNTYRQELATLEADEGKAWAELEMLTGRELIDAHSVAATVNTLPDDGRTARRGAR
ncbi:MAG TPA: TolC family protein, partial [Gemmatimonadaceae bacterium]|nr:TolC family protein [Gemmatimonadaceae bacterium]